ncbi:hypothetical protein LCI18_013640 [Fusarium solani-melongenae]|uniref:Uncharacterized protein n=1 Tax=Fusarium solani subsp. cucurbitae TaxID=2747967 RepID=A0ACD3ZNA1_FUSSC|nr:hypothetical protein LCI18_013640 [Fusarium solani-melongenae]
MPSLKLLAVPLLALASLANASVCKPSSTSSSPEPTSTLPCPAYTPAATAPEGKVCEKGVERTGNLRELVLLSRPASLETCVQLCAQAQGCVSLYVELYDPRESPPYPYCYLFAQKMDDSQFFMPATPGVGAGTYYEFGCYECDRSGE